MLSNVISFLDSLYLRSCFAISGLVTRVADDDAGRGFNDEALETIKNGQAGGGMFEGFYKSAEKVGQDLYQTLMLIGGFGGVILLMIAFLVLATSGTGQKKEEAKSKIFVVLIGVAGLFASVFIVGLAMKIGNGISNAHINN